jgi:hypothetical protein
MVKSLRRALNPLLCSTSGSPWSGKPKALMDLEA